MSSNFNKKFQDAYNFLSNACQTNVKTNLFKFKVFVVKYLKIVYYILNKLTKLTHAHKNIIEDLKNYHSPN